MTAPGSDSADSPEGAANSANGETPASPGSRLLGPGDVRVLADEIGLRPTKQHGQNFVTDGNTIRRIVREAGVKAADVVLEIGPGLGSLTLGLLQTGARVTAVELDERLAEALPGTVRRYAPESARRLAVVHTDALRLAELPEPAPTVLVANLPYNVAVPVLLRVFERIPTIRQGLVMVQMEVAERLAAAPGSKVYGVPTVKSAWYADLWIGGQVGRKVFWPPPNVDSGLVGFTRREPPASSAWRERVFAVVDAAFAQRRKVLRGALAPLAGSADAAQAALQAAGVDPRTRGERLDVEDFTRLAQAMSGSSESSESSESSAESNASGELMDEASGQLDDSDGRWCPAADRPDDADGSDDVDDADGSDRTDRPRGFDG